MGQDKLRPYILLLEKEREEMIFFITVKVFGEKKRHRNGREKCLLTNLLCVWFIVRFTHKHVRLLANRSRNVAREKILLYLPLRDKRRDDCESFVEEENGGKMNIHLYIFTRHFPFWRLGLNNERVRGAVRMPIKGCYTKRLLWAAPAPIRIMTSRPAFLQASCSMLVAL